MPFAKVNEIDLYYEVHGKGNPLVFLSGFSTHHMSWLSFVEDFQNDFQVILLDNRGAGQSSAPQGDYTIEMMASDTLALLDHLNIKKAGFVGSSMGTAIVQTIAYLAPERFEKGVLIAPFHQLPHPSLLKIITTGKLMAAKVPIELVVETAIPWLFGSDFVAHPEKFRKKQEEMVKNPYPQTAEGFMGQFAALKEFDSSPFLEKMEGEFLLLAGEEDLSSPIWCAKTLQQKLKRATLHSFPRTGHMVHVEKRNEIISLMKKFFAI
ncbi:MAG: alpha/beta hydrolase [Chlamydiia bacterium]|nr:alpha/beta hydrolase [Chlamydiia bacterium]